MGRVFQPLLFLLARCARHELIRQIEFLKAENEMLRRRLPRKNIWLTPDERRRLLTLGEAIGPSVAKIITIVTFSTYARWRRAVRKQAPIFRRGRPKTSPEIQELVLKIARETGWGYTRILGELRKLHVKVSRPLGTRGLLVGGPIANDVEQFGERLAAMIAGQGFVRYAGFRFPWHLPRMHSKKWG